MKYLIILLFFCLSCATAWKVEQKVKTTKISIPQETNYTYRMINGKWVRFQLASSGDIGSKLYSVEDRFCVVEGAISFGYGGAIGCAGDISAIPTEDTQSSTRVSKAREITGIHSGPVSSEGGETARGLIPSVLQFVGKVFGF